MEVLQASKVTLRLNERIYESVNRLNKASLQVALNTIRCVTPAGIEPAIFGMKARRPRPLDDGAV